MSRHGGTRELRIADRMGRCIHYTGIIGDGPTEARTCDAGVRYLDVVKDHEPVEYQGRGVDRGHYKSSRSFPCLDSLNRGGASCAKRECLTREQAEAKLAADDAEVEAMLAAFVAVAKDGKANGVVVCPKCSGNLRYACASSNGHIHARCETAGCLAFMQ